MGSPNWNKMKKSIKDYKEKRQSLADSQDEGDQLFFYLRYNQPCTKEEWIELHTKVCAYLHGDNPEEKKRRLRGYTEMLAMTVEAYT